MGNQQLINKAIVEPGHARDLGAALPQLGNAYEVRSAIRVIGAEIKISNREISQTGYTEASFQRLYENLIFFPDASPKSKQLSSDLLAVVANLVDRIRAGASLTELNEKSRTIEEIYDLLAASANPAFKNPSLKIIEYDAALSGVPPRVVEEVHDVEKQLVIDPQKVGPQEGFAYAISPADLDRKLCAPGARLFVMNYNNEPAGFYIAHGDPQYLFADSSRIISDVKTSLNIPENTRVGWVEVVGIKRSSRLAMARDGIAAYAELDAAVFETLSNEQLSCVCALVRKDNLAISSHLRLNWKDAGLELGMNGHVYKVLSRSVCLSSSPAELNNLAFVQKVPDKIRPAEEYRTPYSHKSRYEPSQVGVMHSYMSDQDAIDLFCRLAPKTLSVVPTWCSDGLVINLKAINLSSSASILRARQLLPRRDIWKFTGLVEQTGGLEEVLNSCKTSLFKHSLYLK